MSASRNSAVPDFDPAAVHPELQRLRVAVSKHDWAGVTRFFERVADPNDHEYAASVVGDVAGSDDFLHEAAAKESGAGLARTLYATRLIKVGWELRSAYRAKHVSAERFAAFHDHLRRAERILIELTAEDPVNAGAWVARLRTARGLELGQNEARRRYDQLSRHIPHVYAAQASLVQQFCPKWGGSHAKARAFGVECMRTAPDGSLGSLALVEAHIERYADFDSHRAGAAYLAEPDVRAELYEAAERSVRHPTFRPGYRWADAHNHFALIFSVMGDYASAAPHFRAIGNLANEMFWSYLNFWGRPAAAFSKHRAKALAKG